MYSDLIFERTPAPQVVKGSDTSKLVYKLTNIQLEYETIHNDVLAKEATNVYCSAKAFPYDHIMQEEAIFAKKHGQQAGHQSKPTVPVNYRHSRPYLLFNEPYTAGTRGTEKYVYPDITKGSVTANSPHKRIYNNGIVGHGMWQEISRFFHPKKGISNMNLTKFYTGDKFGLLIDLRSMADTSMHGSV